MIAIILGETETADILAMFHFLWKQNQQYRAILQIMPDLRINVLCFNILLIDLHNKYIINRFSQQIYYLFIMIKISSFRILYQFLPEFLLKLYIFLVLNMIKKKHVCFLLMRSSFVTMFMKSLPNLPNNG